MSENEDNELDELESALEDGDGADGTDDEDDGESDSGSATSKSTGDKDKRISDLMSKWQKAEARAAAAEAKLPKADAQEADGKKVDAPALNPEAQQWIELLREQARDQVFASDPRFAEYKIDRSLVTGTTPEEMKESAARLSGLVDQLEGTMRDSVLERHGLSPDVKSSPARKGKSYADMTDEEFEKELSKAKSAF